MGVILVVEDKEPVRAAMCETLRRDGHQVADVASGAEAVRHLGQHPVDLVIADLKAGGVGTTNILAAVKEVAPRTEVVVVTAYGSIESAVEAMKMGAIDYLTKPLNVDQMLIAVHRVFERSALMHEVRMLRRRVYAGSAGERIIGVSSAVQEILALIGPVAQSDAPVLITGETGTGKELVAHALHEESVLRDRPFVTLNCAALPADLLESELFGHTKGAFTGAVAAKKGLLAEADGGTVFLDEIGEMPASTQAKVLRFLEAGEIRPVGSNVTTRVHVRLLAATNRDLAAALEAKQFRDDLYYRLSVITVHVPPLRDRVEDIPLLASHFLRLVARRANKRGLTFTDEALAALTRHPWPGNVRELRNVIDRAVTLARERMITADLLHLPVAPHGSSAPGGASPRLLAMADVERAHILEVLRHCGGNQTRAARVLGISKITLWRKLKTYRAHPPEAGAPRARA